MPELTILQGDALTRLRELPDSSVNCCVTSPPYFGLRDYGNSLQKHMNTFLCLVRDRDISTTRKPLKSLQYIPKTTGRGGRMTQTNAP